MTTSFRRKNHKEERFSDASDFFAHVSKCVQSIWKQYQPLETISLDGLEKGHHQAPLETEANWTQNTLFFTSKFQFKRISAFFHI